MMKKDHFIAKAQAHYNSLQEVPCRVSNPSVAERIIRANLKLAGVGTEVDGISCTGIGRT
jgi:hypothetical protein